MLLRAAHYWLCCTGFNIDDILAQLGDVQTRVKLAPRPTNKFGPYDYIFIDASDEDWPLDLLLEQLLNKLETFYKAIIKWGDDLTSGVHVIVRTNEVKHSEMVTPTMFERLSKLNLGVTFTYEHVFPENA